MILSRFTLIKISSSNAHYWKSLGYSISKVGGRAGKNNGSRIKVKVSDLKSGSNVNVSCRCDQCNEKYIQRFSRNTKTCYSCRKRTSMLKNKFGFNRKNTIQLTEEQIDSLRRGKKIKQLAKEIGCNHVSLTRHLKNKNINTLPTKEILEELANENYSLDKICQELKRSSKTINSLLEEYNITLKPNLQRKNYEIEEIQKLNKEGKSLKQISKILNISDVRVSQICKENNIDWILQPNVYNFSQPESDILNIVLKYDQEARKRKYDNLEFDIVSQKYSFAIEYCGLYWHSSRTKDANYHYKKYLKAKELDLHLFTIFEDEWLEKRSIVESIIRKQCNDIERKIFARKTTFSTIDSNTSKSFHEKNHIQGMNKNPKHSFGLYYANELVAVMSFDNHPRNDSFTLSRYSTKLESQVIGGASKLFKNAQSVLNFDECISWSDNRWFDGNLYAQLNFDLDGNLSPDYSYCYRQKRKSKQSHKKNLINCPKNITEREFLESKGIYRIYDCGKKRWIWKK